MMREPKPLPQRLAEVAALYRQLDGLGLSPEFPGIRQFREIANAFVRDGTGASGRIPLPEAGRTLVYRLTTQPHLVSDVVLRMR